MSQIKIVSDGTPGGTIVSLADGTPLPNVSSVHWGVDPEKLATAIVQFEHVKVELIGKADIPAELLTEQPGQPWDHPQ